MTLRSSRLHGVFLRKATGSTMTGFDNPVNSLNINWESFDQQMEEEEEEEDDKRRSSESYRWRSGISAIKPRRQKTECSKMNRGACRRREQKRCLQNNHDLHLRNRTQFSADGQWGRVVANGRFSFAKCSSIVVHFAEFVKQLSMFCAASMKLLPLWRMVMFSNHCHYYYHCIDLKLWNLEQNCSFFKILRLITSIIIIINLQLSTKQYSEVCIIRDSCLSDARSMLTPLSYGSINESLMEEHRRHQTKPLLQCQQTFEVDSEKRRHAS